MALTVRVEVRERGFARREGVFSDEDLNAVDTGTRRMIESWRRGHSDPDFWAYNDASKRRLVLYRIHNLQCKHESVAALIEHEGLRALIATVMGEPAVATACALIYKTPYVGASVPWHRDPIEVPPHTVYNFSIFLDRSTKENGALAFVPASHADGRDFAAGCPADAVLVEADRGDVVIHDVRTYHGSGVSRSAYQRRSIVFEFQPLRLARETILPGTVIL